MLRKVALLTSMVLSNNYMPRKVAIVITYQKRMGILLPQWHLQRLLRLEMMSTFMRQKLIQPLGFVGFWLKTPNKKINKDT